ncbi:coenzyme F420 hydrogenase [candidate division WOR-3 bacterium]|uniref:Coenzyme F420 hydrogenase n=1 Tax=candidate division WOR-3 bacterium TaxID=2052148 RepID=A0A660SJT2_UNCW3|nr:MAG: coenzyme F420 hydrogenase [candidate division WOR-3 bacterium]
MKAIRINQPFNESLRELLRSLLEKGKVGAVFALTRIGSGYSYTLITDPKLLDQITPIDPYMPVGGGKMLSRLTMIEPLTQPIAAVIRPCELRSLYELVKLEQANLDNLLIISLTCPGVRPIRGLATDRGETLRECCQICDRFIPEKSDLTLLCAGEDGNVSTILINTEQGERFLEGLPFDYVEAELKVPEGLKESRKKKRQETFSRLKPEDLGMEGLINIFGRCIGCHACGRACPICYCNLCYFDSEESESHPKELATDLELKGALRLPTNTIFYHLGRMIHVSLSCVGCGMCSDVCPVEIPVGTIFTRIAESGQKLFDYIPGRDLEEKLPTSTFKIEELKDLGEA